MCDLNDVIDTTYAKPLGLLAVTSNDTAQSVVRTIFSSLAMDVIVEREVVELHDPPPTDLQSESWVHTFGVLEEGQRFGSGAAM